MRIGRSTLFKSSLVLLLCIGTMIPVLANSDNEKFDGSQSNPSSQHVDQKNGVETISEKNVMASSMLDDSNAVYINDQIEMRLTQLQTMPDTESQIVSFTLTITNDSHIDLNFIDYWVQLKTTKGTEYSIDYLTGDKDQDIIPAKSTKDFQFYAEVAPDLTYDDFIFELIAWDFNATNYRRSIGSIKAPKGYTPLVKQGDTGTIRHANSRYHFRIDELHMKDQKDQTKRLELELILENMSSRSTALPDISYSLLTEDGYIYLLEPTNAVEDSLAPRIETTLELSGQLPEDIDLSTARFLIFSNGEQVDLPLALYELPGATDAPEPPAPAQVGVGDKFEIELDRTDIHMSVTDYTLVEQKEEKDEEQENDKDKDKDKDKEEKKDPRYDATVTVLFENVGQFSGNVPAYEYTIEFLESGDVFPLTLQEDSSVPLHPRMKHELELLVTVPEELIHQPVELVIRSLEEDESGDIDYDLIASFDVPDATIIEDEEEPDEEEPEKEMVKYNVRDIYRYETKQGDYFIYLEKMERYPWENEDILAAQFIVSNPGQKTLQIPDLAGTFKLDDIALTDYETEIVTSNRVLSIMPGQEIEMMLYIKIPYSYDYASSGLIISGLDEPPVAEDEDEDDQLEEIEDVEFIYNRDLATIPQQSVGEPVVFDFISTKTELLVRDLITYKGDESQTVYIQAEMENLEKRESNLPDLKAYLQVGKSHYVPLNVSYEGALSPGGKALVVFSSTVANRYNVNDMKLVIGELIPEQEAYLNTVAIELPESEQAEPKRAPQNLTMYPYTLSMNDVKPDFSVTDSIRFGYELTVEDGFEILPEGQQVVIEYTDGDAKFERSYQVGKDIKLGEHQLNFVIDIPAEELIDMIGGFEGHFTINIYSEYDENRILLSSTNYTYY